MTEEAYIVWREDKVSASTAQKCVHPQLETDRKYSARYIFHAVQFCGII